MCIERHCKQLTCDCWIEWTASIRHITSPKVIIYSFTVPKWSDAEEKLWASDVEEQLTTIGHICREVMQGFATSLKEQYQLSNVDPDVQHDQARIRAVLDARSNHLQETEKPFLKALIDYWVTVSNLVQRQEHGAQRERQALVWEDARRIVFHTAVVMYEIDQALSR
jgi:hypothetical protein